MFKFQPIATLWLLVLFLLVGSAWMNFARADQTQRLPHIQLAILLDTSGSMDGLIDQTRNQLWQVVNEFSTARQGGLTPVLEIALYEYGNDSASSNRGFVRKISGFTRELDQISQGLFALTTNGGSEYCGYAIQSALNDLQWSNADSDIKTIFIAGNEPFTQGPVDYRDAVEQARRMGVTINTIHAGDYQAGILEGWRSGALLAGGDYMSIDHNIQVVHLEAPQDEQIAKLNQQLNATYLPYGEQGSAKHELQLEQDAQSSQISSGLLAKRARVKASTFYDNSSWDLVDAYRQGNVDVDSIKQYEAATLPSPMQEMTPGEQIEYLDSQSKERESIQQKINELSKSRDAYLAEKRAETAEQAPSMSDALVESVKKQAEVKSFEFIE